MPRNSTQHITHTLGGGWATDMGPTYYGGPDGSQLKLPWLSQAENLLYTLDGGCKKWPGTSHINNSVMTDQVIGATRIKGITDYWKTGTSGTPSQQIIASIGSSYFNVGLTPTLIGTTSSSVEYARPHFSTFNDLLILAAEGTSPKSWDQATYQALAGTPPSFRFSTPHQGRHWASGNIAAPSRLYYSVVGSPEDWVGSGSGSIDIDPGDGDAIVGMISWKKELFVFKGPNKLSIHRISGSSPTDFARTPYVYGVSASGPNAIFQYGDDVGFWSPRGSCHSLTATANFGDYSQALINYPILSWCRDNRNLNTGSAAYWQAVTNTNENYTLFNYTGKGSGFAQNNQTILMDWKFTSKGDEIYPRFSRLTYHPFTSVAMVGNSGQTFPCFGGKDGQAHLADSDPIPHRGGGAFVHRMLNATRTPIPFQFQTPYLTYGTDLETKTVSNISLTLSTAHRSTVTVKWGGSKQPKLTTTVAQPGYTPLGSFVLGTDCLGELGTQPVFCQDLSGDFRSIQYNIIEDSAVGATTSNDGAGIQLTTFGASITPTGESTEN